MESADEEGNAFVPNTLSENKPCFQLKVDTVMACMYMVNGVDVASGHRNH